MQCCPSFSFRTESLSYSIWNARESKGSAGLAGTLTSYRGADEPSSAFFALPPALSAVTAAAAADADDDDDPELRILSIVLSTSTIRAARETGDEPHSHTGAFASFSTMLSVAVSWEHW